MSFVFFFACQMIWENVPPGTIGMVICSFDASSLLPENLNAAESADEARTTAITTHNLGLDPPHQQLPRPSTDSRESRKSFQSSKRFSLTQFGNISLTSFPPVSTLSGSSAGCGGEIDKSESTPTLLTAPAAAAVHGHLVNLEVGEYVHILESYESHWYRGYVSTVCYSDQNRSITGVGGGGSGGTAGSLTTIKLGVFPASSVVLLKDPRFKLSKTSTSSSNLNNSPLQTCRNLKRVRTQKLFRRPTLQMKQKRNQADLDHINKFVLQSYAEQQQETTGVNSGGGVSTPYEQQDGSSSDNQPLAGGENKKVRMKILS